VVVFTDSPAGNWGMRSSKLSGIAPVSVYVGKKREVNSPFFGQHALLAGGGVPSSVNNSVDEPRSGRLLMALIVTLCAVPWVVALGYRRDRVDRKGPRKDMVALNKSSRFVL